MKRLAAFVIFTLLLCHASTGAACVGRILYLGTLQANSDKLMAEMISLLIAERTGTTIQIRSFDSPEQLYRALKSSKEEERVDIVVEDTVQGLSIAKQASSGSADQDFLAVKAHYEKEFDVVWLNPFGYSRDAKQRSISAPLVRRDVLTNFPLLPRVLNKLAGAINDAAFQELSKALEGGDKPKNVARDFLKKQKLI